MITQILHPYMWLPGGKLSVGPLQKLRTTLHKVYFCKVSVSYFCDDHSVSTNQCAITVQSDVTAGPHRNSVRQHFTAQCCSHDIYNS